MVCLEQMYVIFLSFADNHYKRDYNEPILIQQPLNEGFLSLVILLSVLSIYFIVSGVKSSR